MTVPTKNITFYFHAKTNSSHTHQAPDHEVLQHVLSSSDNDSDDECAYMYTKGATEELISDSDGSDTPKLSDISMEEMDISTMVVQSKEDILPFVKISAQRYALQNRLAKHNLARDSIHQATAVESDDDGTISHVNRSEV